MVRSDTEIRYIAGQTNYGPMDYGKYAGEPVVNLKLSSSKQNGIKVTSLRDMFDNNGWLRKLQRGNARLNIYGDDPSANRHAEPIDYLNDVFDPEFLDLQLDGEEVSSVPSGFFGNKINTVSLVFDLASGEPDYDEQIVEQIIDLATNKADFQVIFKVDSVGCESYVQDFAREYNIYDSDIWLFPKGRKVSTTADSLRKAQTVAKRNTWNVSPRVDLLKDFEPDDG